MEVWKKSVCPVSPDPFPTVSDTHVHGTLREQHLVSSVATTLSNLCMRFAAYPPYRSVCGPSLATVLTELLVHFNTMVETM